MNRPRTSALLLAAAAALAGSATAADVCQARSGAQPPAVVELYTSEGCSSCPPADRWLSTLKGRPDVLALAFHVTYWDQLGWADRFATREGTARQYALAHGADGGGPYTPQIVANGRDWRQWPKLPAALGTAPAPTLTLQRDADTVVATVGSVSAGTPLAGYWVVLEDGHQSQVRAGENAGEQLRHDHVVRLYKPVPAWTGGAAQRLQLQVSRGDAAFPRRVALLRLDQHAPERRVDRQPRQIPSQPRQRALRVERAQLLKQRVAGRDRRRRRRVHERERLDLAQA